MSTIDDALLVLHKTGPEFAGGLSNHGPMAADALFALGRAELVMPWVERYVRELDVHPQARRSIVRDDWRGALGDHRRVGDWIAFFDTELADRSWQSVLDEWAGELAGGFVAAGTHGLIRTGHAARMLSAAETPGRVHELAEGLGFWAARYQRLPERRGAPGQLAPSEAIREVERVRADEQVTEGLITDQLRPLETHDSFPAVANLVTARARDPGFLSDLTETFARVYLANVDQTGEVIGFIHSVTSPSAVRLITPHVSAATAETLSRYAWQAAAALYAAMGRNGPVEVPVEPPAASADDLASAAAATNDPHAIKFTEACLREYDVNPNPVYLAAAADATARLQPSG